MNFLISASILQGKNKTLRVHLKTNNSLIENSNKAINNFHIVSNSFALRGRIVIWWNSNSHRRKWKEISFRSSWQYRYRSRCNWCNSYKILRNNWSHWRTNMSNFCLSSIPNNKWSIFAKSTMSKDLANFKRRSIWLKHKDNMFIDKLTRTILVRNL